MTSEALLRQMHVIVLHMSRGTTTLSHLHDNHWHFVCNVAAKLNLLHEEDA